MLSALDTILDNVNWLTAVLALVVCVFFYVYIQWIHMPPGPMGLPYLGYYPFLGPDYYVQLQNMSKKYGDVFCIRVTGQLFVYLGSTQAIKEAHVTKSDCFTQRPTRFSIVHDIVGGGVTMVNGEAWKEMRKFFVQRLKEFGLGKKTQESLMGDYLEKTVSTIRKTDGENFDALSFFTHMCTEVIYSMLISGTKRNEDDLKKFNEAYALVTETMVGKTSLLSGPLLKLMVNLHPAFKIYRKNKYFLDAELAKIVEEHEKDFDKDNIRDLVDCCINMRKELEDKGDRRSEMYTGKGLQNSLIQFIGDGGFSIGYIVAFVLKDLYARPEIQKEMQREIDTVVGRSRFPCWDDRTRMPYTNAVMYESFRRNDFFPLLQSLQCTKETTVGDCRVPKGAVTLVSFWAAFHNPDTFENPDAFDPTRFLPNDDEQKPKSEIPIFFGVGKRSCIGEPVVLMETFLFVTAVLQNFDLHPALEPDPRTTDSPPIRQEIDERNVVFRATPRAS